MFMSQGMRMRTRKVSALAACTTVLLSSCVTTQTGRIGADDGSDACYAYVKTMDATGDYFTADMIVGAMVSGGRDTGKAAAIGAASGAALGAVGGCINHRMQQDKGKAILYQNVRSDYDRELVKLDEAQFALSKVIECREGQFSRITADHRVGKTTQPPGAAALGQAGGIVYP